MGEFKVRKGFSFIGLVLTLLLMGILAGGMYSLGGRDSGGISVVKTATDTAETTRILAELEALKAGRVSSSWKGGAVPFPGWTEPWTPSRFTLTEG